MNGASDPSTPFILRRLNAMDASAFRALRLDGLRDHPEAFGASWEDESLQPLDWFADRLERHAVFGGWRDAATLSGIAGLVVPASAKQRHRGTLWGMYVEPRARGSGLAAALVARIIREAAACVEDLCLTVTTSNTAAVRLYAAAGFTRYGVERRGLKVGDQYYDSALMVRPLR